MHWRAQKFAGREAEIAEESQLAFLLIFSEILHLQKGHGTVTPPPALESNCMYDCENTIKIIVNKNLNEIASLSNLATHMFYK